MHIEIDDKSGFCFGVVRAISEAEKALEGGGTVYSLGDIVHNRMEVQRLERLGMRTVTHGEMPSLRGKRLFIRAHGEPPTTYREAERLGIGVIDATCPVVARLQARVVKAAGRMREAGGQVVILGKRGHAEVVGLTGQVDDPVTVIEGAQDLDAVDFTRPVYFLSQTTQSIALFEALGAEMLRRASDPAQVHIDDTICRQVANREQHLSDFSQRFDAVIFVCGRKSSNGKVLFEVCRRANPRSYNIEEAAELDTAWFRGAESVGICGATSTPKWLMQEVADAIDSIAIKNEKLRMKNFIFTDLYTEKSSDDTEIVRLTACHSMEDLYDQLAAALCFPKGFGRNLDALWDSICSLDNFTKRNIVLVHADLHIPVCFDDYISLLADAAADWDAYSNRQNPAEKQWPEHSLHLVFPTKMKPQIEAVFEKKTENNF